MYRLLLVTDKGDVRDLYRSYADWNQQGFEQPTIASGAEEGMAALSAQRFDVVSCLLPVEEGKVFYARVRDSSDSLGMETVRDQNRLRREIACIRRELISRDSERGAAETADLLRARQEEFFCGMLRGEGYDRERLEGCLRELELADRIHPTQPGVCASFRIPEGERFLEGVWKYGKARLEFALKNVFEAGDGRMTYTLLTLNPHHMRILALPGGACTQTEAYEQLLSHLGEARRTIEQCFDMTLVVKRVNSYKDLFAYSRENILRTAH